MDTPSPRSLREILVPPSETLLLEMDIPRPSKRATPQLTSNSEQSLIGRNRSNNIWLLRIFRNFKTFYFGMWENLLTIIAIRVQWYSYETACTSTTLSELNYKLKLERLFQRNWSTVLNSVYIIFYVIINGLSAWDEGQNWIFFF